MDILKKFYKDASLRTRFITLFVAFALIPVLILGVLVHSIAQKTNLKDMQAHLVLEAELIAKGYSGFLESNENILDILGSEKEFAEFLAGDTGLEADVMEKMLSTKRFLGTVSSIYLVDTTGKVVMDTENARVGQDFSDREYFRRSKQTGLDTMSLGRLDEVTKQPSIVTHGPVKASNGSVVGYLSLVDDLSALSEGIVDNVQIMESGYTFVVENETMNVLMTPRKDQVLSDYLKAIPGYTEALANKNVHTFAYTFNGDKKLGAFVTDEKLNWTFAAEVAESEVNQVSTRTLWALVIISLFIIVLVPVLAIFVSRSIIKPISHVTDAMGQVAGGDLTIALGMEGKDEVMVMGQRLDSTVAALNESVAGVKDVATEVQEYSDNLSKTVKQMSSATGEVASAIQDVADAAITQASDLTEIVNMFSIFAAEMEAISVHTGNVNESALKAESKASEGKDQVAELSTSIAYIGGSFGTFMKTISDLGLSVGKIGDITDAINAISDQTNLLALNAAIEAARAGEQGKGFAVVADEVRNLAAESKKSSEEIMEVIRRVSQETQGVIKASEEVNSLLSDQEKVINNTVESFQLITDAINTIGPLVAKAEASVVKASQAKDGVINRVEGVATVSEEVSASAQEIAASSQELLSSIEDVSGVSNRMTHSVRNLTERVKIYRTR
ncbi:MAG: methyl-accepting chemotaxis protein [Peptococcaceae bacterium]|nr:methyl-accepting chemotaxis protein [Peptococcaceae bacterium]